MDLFFQQLVNGLSLGALYALIAVGYTVVYGIVQLINFAHGEIFMIGRVRCPVDLHARDRRQRDVLPPGFSSPC